MTKKISGIDGVREVDQIGRIEELEKIERMREVTGVSSVGAVGRVSHQGKIEGVGPRLTESNQAEVLARIESEAQKMFEGKRIPRQRQKTITDALKMAVMAATIKEDLED
jgi:hypothetical protein